VKSNALKNRVLLSVIYFGFLLARLGVVLHPTHMLILDNFGYIYATGSDITELAEIYLNKRWEV